MRAFINRLFLFGLGLALALPLHADWQTQEGVVFDYSPRLQFDRVNRQYLSQISVTNDTDATISGPLRVLIESSSHQILNAESDESGLMFMSLDQSSLSAGETHSVRLALELKRAAFSIDLGLQAQRGSDGDSGSTSVLELGEDQIALFYQREDQNYTGWGLHLWNGEGCGNYASPTVDSPHFNNWPDPYPVDGVHPDFGAYFVLSIEPGADCYNFILHKGDERALGSGNSRFEPGQAQEAFTFHGFPEIWYQPLANRPAIAEGSRAHWMQADALLWLTDIDAATDFRLYHSKTADLELLTSEVLAEADYVPLQPAFVDSELFAENPHLQGFSGLSVNLDKERIKSLLTEQLIAVALDSQGNLVDATRVQRARVLDDIYTSGEQDADEAQLGVTYDSGRVTASVWAPTAQAVNIQLFNKDKRLLTIRPMQLDEDTGVWSFTAPEAALDRRFYCYELQVYHPRTEDIETLEATDPYSVSLSSNGRYTQFVNLDDADLKPAGWDEHVVPEVTAPEDAVIYETHIRDFSILDETVSPENRGKYLAFTESDSRPVQHLKKLQQAGLTYVHLLPANDIASIKETPEERVDITDTVGRLCELNGEAPVCGVENEQDTLLEVLESYTPGTTDAQALIESMRGLDGFNWGYDPHHFAAPEGSYASDPDGAVRIYEIRAMNQALHEMGLRSVLDVVYNHTASSGLYDKSVLDKVVPGYYHRLNEASGQIENSTCCENTATEHRMMAKLMSDSLVIFAEQFGFDAFRFDLMGHIPSAAVLEARDAVRSVDPDTYFYGEGWNFGEVVNNRRFHQAAQLNMGGTEVGTFSDRQRDAVRSAAIFNQGGSLDEQDTIRIGLAGNIKDYKFVTASGAFISSYDYRWNGQPAGYAEDPADTVNYVSKHDNETLWDQLQFNLPGHWSAQQRVRVHNQALAMPLLSQGIPFVHLGSDLLRSKSMDRNSFDSGDWFNRVDFTFQDNNWNVGLPRAQDNQNNWPAISNISANPNIEVDASQIEFASQVFREFLQIRTSSRLFRLTKGEQVQQRLKFHNTGNGQLQGVIVMSLDDGLGLTDLDPERDAIVVMINGTDSHQSYFIEGASRFELHPVQRSSVDSRLAQAGFNAGSFEVPARTTAVFVKPQEGGQGFGLSALPPYGDQPIYLRGEMNGWDTSLAFSYQGNDQYLLEASLPSGEFEFKIADEAFGVANIGGGFQVALNQPSTLQNRGNNLSMTLPVQDNYRFELDASDADRPELTIIPESGDLVPPPYGEHTVFVRGEMNGWGTSWAMEYIGNGIYRGLFNVPAGSHQFKLADSEWGASGGPNLGGTAALQPGQSATLYNGSNDNLRIDAPETADYPFVLDANNPQTPLLTVELP